MSAKNSDTETVTSTARFAVGVQRLEDSCASVVRVCARFQAVQRPVEQLRASECNRKICCRRQRLRIRDAEKRRSVTHTQVSPESARNVEHVGSQRQRSVDASKNVRVAAAVVAVFVTGSDASRCSEDDSETTISVGQIRAGSQTSAVAAEAPAERLAERRRQFKC